MSTALPKIDQLGKPVGIAGRSRDDLDLDTGPNPFQLSDAGVGATVWLWELLDQPPGATCVISNPALATTTAPGATVAGTYRFQLTVDGGLAPGQIYIIDAAVQIALPAWVGITNDRLRIPAFGETTDFNELPDGSGLNTRGWAAEMEIYLRTLASYAFGVEILNVGVPLGASSFRKLNFTGAVLVDAGNGQVDITLAGGGGVTQVSNQGGLVAGGPWTSIDSAVARASLFFPTLNAQFQSTGPSSLALHVTAAEHRRHDHSPTVENGVRLDRTSLAPSLNNVPNPPEWTFQPIEASAQLTSNGRILTSADIAAPVLYNPVLVPPGVWGLADIVLDPATIAPASILLAFAAQSAVQQIILTDISPDHPGGAFGLAITGAPGAPRMTWNLGPPVLISSVGLYRLYMPDGVQWVDVYVNSIPALNSANIWTVSPTLVLTDTRYPIVRASYADLGAGPKWGVLDKFIDRRPFGSIGPKDVSHAAVVALERLPADTRLSGVVFTDRIDPAGPEDKPLTGFALVPLVPGAPAPSDATAMLGGTFYIRGRRYTYPDVTQFRGYLPPASTVIIFVKIEESTGLAEVGFDAGFANPVSAVRSLTRIHGAEGSTYGEQVGVPLFWGTTNGAGDLVALERIDLRRDVAHMGDYTVGTRSMLDPTHDVFSAQAPIATASQKHALVTAVAEYECIAAALVYYSAEHEDELESNGSDNFRLHGTANDNAPLHVRVIGNTYEGYPFTLWKNVTLEGVGYPTVRVEPRADGLGFLQVGAPRSAVLTPGDRLVRNVVIKGLRVLPRVPVGQADQAAITIHAPEWDSSLPLFATQVPVASADNITVEDCLFSTLDAATVTAGDQLAAIRLLAEESSGPPFIGGSFRGINILYNRVSRDTKAVGGNSASLYRYGVDIWVTESLAPGVNENRNIRIQDNTFDVYENGILIQTLGGAPRVTGLWIERNDYHGFDTGTTQFFFSVAVDLLSDVYIRDNRATLNSSTAGGMSLSAVLTDAEVSNNRLESTALGFGGIGNIGDCNRVRFSQNFISGFGQAFIFAGGLFTLEVSDNILSSVNNGAGDQIGMQFFGTSIGGLYVLRNKIRLFRVGVQVSMDATSRLAVIDDNDIQGQPGPIGGGAGTYYGQGIICVVEENVVARESDIYIRRNTIQNYAIDGGVLGVNVEASAAINVQAVNNAPAVWLKGVHITDNIINARNDTGAVAGIHFFREAMSGIILFGGWDDVDISRNSIVNDRYAVDKESAGILLDKGVATTLAASQGRTVRGNRVAWMGATTLVSAPTITSEADRHCAAILAHGSWDRLVVTQNYITCHSVLKLGGAGPDYGYIHGIMAEQGSTRVGAGMTISDNQISTAPVCFFTIAQGAIGCPILVTQGPGPADALVVCDIVGNRIIGSWQHQIATLAFEQPGWAGISVLGRGDQGAADVSINNNFVLLTSVANDIGGPRLLRLISFGGDEYPNAGPISTIDRVHICGNDVSGNVADPAATYPGRTSGGIVTQAKKLAGAPHGDANHLVVSQNKVQRGDGGVNVAKGIYNSGLAHALFDGNRVVASGGGAVDIEDVNTGGAMPAQNIWLGNHFAGVGVVGTAALGAPPYVAPASPTNWSGGGFLLDGVGSMVGWWSMGGLRRCGPGHHCPVPSVQRSPQWWGGD